MEQNLATSMTLLEAPTSWINGKWLLKNNENRRLVGRHCEYRELNNGARIQKL